MSWAIIVLYAKQAWTWVRQNLGAVLLCVIGFFTGAALLRRKDSQIGTLKEALAAEKHKSEIKRLQAEAQALAERDASSVVRDRVLGTEVAKVEAQMAVHKKKLLELHNRNLDPSKMTDAEVEESFRAAGL